MALIIDNKKLAEGIFLMRVSSNIQAPRPGQFVMLRPEGDGLFLARPISVMDWENGVWTFLYKVVGKGTDAFSRLESGDDIFMFGPMGNGFGRVLPLEKIRKAVLIGGGMGIAPMYGLAKALKKTGAHVKIHLGFTDEPILRKEFSEVAEELVINVGGYVTDDVRFEPGTVYFACGPDPMMRAAARKAREAGAELIVSLESRMACGMGACLGCTIDTANGSKRVCKDGPCFRSEEVTGLGE
ncbi:MAG: dihydroorotate dehydrogenase electron transfer subunit [Firmicutes bacterium]|nr:dihydroorotate dehydrogenase electron transfer subunit [Bacillota bacterium]